jgi:PII-like signaling protein
VIHTASLVELSSDLPVLIEVVDGHAHVDRLIPILDEMITSGALVTVERVRVLRYAGAQEGIGADSRFRGSFGEDAARWR